VRNSGLGVCRRHNDNLSGILKAAFQSLQARRIVPIVICQYDFQIFFTPSSQNDPSSKIDAVCRFVKLKRQILDFHCMRVKLIK
jgi:hypothetical protein